VDDVARYSPYVTLTGGEPLMFPQVGDLITYIGRHNMRCTLTTNGVLLAKRLPDFADAPPDLIVVSIDGPPDLHNEIRGQDRVFERAVEGIKAVREIRAANDAKKPLLAINCAITSFSYQRVEEMVDLATEIGVDGLNFQHQWTITQRMVDDHNAIHGAYHTMSAEGLGVAKPEPVDLEKMVDTVRRIRERAKGSTHPIITFHPELSDDEIRQWYADPHNWVQRKPATCAWINTEILPNGNVEPCFNYKVGNVAETPLSEMWNSNTYREFRQRLAEAEDFPMCVRCCAFFRRD